MKGGKIMAQNFLTYEQQIAKLRDDISGNKKETSKPQQDVR
jgi:hypothetical protein